MPPQKGLGDLIGFWNSQGLKNVANPVKNAQIFSNNSGNKLGNVEQNFRVIVNNSRRESEKCRGGVPVIVTSKPEENQGKEIKPSRALSDLEVNPDQKNIVIGTKDIGNINNDSLGEGYLEVKIKKDNQNVQTGILTQESKVSPFEKFRQLEQTNQRNQNSIKYKTAPPKPKICIPNPIFLPKSPVPSPAPSPGLCPPCPVRSASAAKEIILTWVQKQLKDYPISVTNFSSSWSDGLAFCFLLHNFFPQSFDWKLLQPENREDNFTLAFKKAEELADICPLLDVEDMVKFDKPDWKCVFTYVQSFYRRFRDVKAPDKDNKTENEDVEKNSLDD